MTNNNIPKYEPIDCIPSCGGKLHLRHSAKFNRLFWGCERYPACDVAMGAHQSNGKPLGIPADKQTRQCRIQAHAAFDPIYGRDDKDMARKERNKRRTLAYKWLAKQLGIKDVGRDCHIAMFDQEQCQKVIAACEGKTWKDIDRWNYERRMEHLQQKQEGKK